MRVPNALRGADLRSELNRIQYELERARREISTGKRIRAPSDDPSGAARASLAQSEIRTLEQYLSNTDKARDKLLAVDNVIDRLEKLTDAALSAAAAGRSGTATAEQFAAISLEVEGLRKEMLSLANTKKDEAYLFAGRRSLTPAFQETAGAVSYQGDAVAPTLRVGGQTVVETSVTGSDLFMGALDAFQVLSDLRDALAAGDTSRVAIEFTNLEQVSTHFTQYRVQAGLAIEQLDQHHLRIRAELADETVALGRDTDADLAQSITRFNELTSALDASIKSGARLLSVSLMDVLG